ncbi:YIP1 family protein [Halovivax cerinus]|uniref:YIP1 family protein n=1 Tax=Halovivax cerinus TaxID=1487865 RepID=A0ABD5NPT2_9EURY|nr:YIP1 family protein [Halovivax cerinus]
MVLKRSLRALVLPHEAFDGWTPGPRVVVGIVVVVCLASGVSMTLAGDAVADEVEGTVAVDNPYGPPEGVCDGERASFYNCDAPETVDRSLGTAASNAVGGVTPRAALAPFAWMVLIAGLPVLVAGRAGRGDGDAIAAFRDGLGIAALAAVPGLLRYAARPIAVERVVADWTHPGTLDGVRTAAVSQLFPDGSLWLAVVTVSGVWTAAIVYGGVASAFDVGRGKAALIAAVAFVSTAASAALANGGWIGAPIGFGLLLVVGGIVGLLGAYTYSTVSKELELIGFGGSETVTPEPWYVGLHRAGALIGLAFGFVLVDGIAVV